MTWWIYWKLKTEKTQECLSNVWFATLYMEPILVHVNIFGQTIIIQSLIGSGIEKQKPGQETWGLVKALNPAKYFLLARTFTSTCVPKHPNEKYCVYHLTTHFLVIWVVIFWKSILLNMVIICSTFGGHCVTPDNNKVSTFEEKPENILVWTAE